MSIMEDVTRTVQFEADHHYHSPRSSDWYWALGILGIAGSVTAILLGNMLFGVLIIVATLVVTLVSLRPISTVPYIISQRGIQIDDVFHPYATLESFYIDEHNYSQPVLLIKAERMFTPLFVIPIPDEYVMEIEDVLASRIPEEHLEEPVLMKLLEFFGF